MTPPHHAAGMAPAMSHPGDLFKSPLSVMNLIRFRLEPAIIMGTLVAIAWTDGHEFYGAYFILSLLLFSFTFPGN